MLLMMGDPQHTFSGTGLFAGEVLLGKYRLERVLGRGGMGFVVAATHLGLDQLVAIKMLLPSSLDKKDVLSRFAREARAAAKLRNEHVVRVTDVGDLPSGAPYLVMEYLRGKDLADVLIERGPLPIDRAIDYVLQALEAIAEAHAFGMVHRDLKPANLFLASGPGGGEIVKLLDFGISKASEDPKGEALALTGAGVLIGSPRYMSPEQIRSAKDCDAGTDIWSVGVIAYELITGRVPFESASSVELVAEILTAEPAALPPEVPAGLRDTILRCLAKDRARRPGSALELARAIAPFGSVDAALAVERVRAAGEARERGDALAATSLRPALPFTESLSEKEARAFNELRDSVQITQGTLSTERRSRGTMALFLVLGLVLAAALAAVLVARKPEVPTMVPKEAAIVKPALTSSAAVKAVLEPIREPRHEPNREPSREPNREPNRTPRRERAHPNANNARDPLDVQPY
jgi:serine/threonine-protein kinase